MKIKQKEFQQNAQSLQTRRKRTGAKIKRKESVSDASGTYELHIMLPLEYKNKLAAMRLLSSINGESSVELLRQNTQKCIDSYIDKYQGDYINFLINK